LSGKSRRCDTISSIIFEFGKKAGVKVAERGPKLKYASAHDLRRAFGFRWSARVMPPVLQHLVRHECILTTMTFHIGRNAEVTADAFREAFAARRSFGTPLTKHKQNTLDRPPHCQYVGMCQLTNTTTVKPVF